MNASKRILVDSKDREIIDAIRSVAASLSCFVSTVNYKAAGTIDMGVLAIGYFARVFDAEVFQLIAHDLQEMINEYGVPQGPSLIIGDLGDSDSGDGELFSDANDPLWNDLIKIPVATNSSSEESAVTEITRSLISLELAVLQPDVALFMVDQTEETEIMNAVSGAALYDIPSVDPTLGRHVAGGGLPNASYRVCREAEFESDDHRASALADLLRAELEFHVA